MDTNTNKKKRANYKDKLDKPLTPNQRKIALTVLEAESVQEVADKLDLDPRTVNNAMLKPEVNGLKVTQLLSRDAAMRKILVFCEDILSRDIETPLKASDKVAAARLLAEITGVLEEKKGDTYNIGVLDMREATTEELARELARIEDMKRSAVDAQVVSGDTH